jgi:GNAT superfamily N-acetyltransferase
MGPLKLLFDTNVFYACVDISRGRQHRDSAAATRLRELLNRHGGEAWLTDATRRDIDRTSNPELRHASNLMMRQWPTLEPLTVPQRLLEEARYQLPLSDNDDVDTHMLAALDAESVDFLITQDKALRRHADYAGLGDRTMTIQDGIELLERLLGEPTPLPTVRPCAAYGLRADDPLFESLRAGDSGFDAWFQRARQEHRQCFAIDGEAGLDAAAILMSENDRPHGIGGTALKISAFIVADRAEGAKREELLLKSVLDYAADEEHDRIYIEICPHHDRLVPLFEQFGFVDGGERTDRGEAVLCKDRRPATDDAQLDPLAYHRRFGPPALLVRNAFVVPIQPRWHDVLFPEAREQAELFAPPAPGNAMLKAYLSRSNIQRVESGALILFYRSEDRRAVTAVGVVDGRLRSNDPVEIRRFVGARTVYTDAELGVLCAGDRGVLAILFRHDRVLPAPWPLDELVQADVVRDAPQTIQEVTNEAALSWIRQRLEVPR